MSLQSGELLAAADLPTFDEALVAEDVCVVSAVKRVSAVDTQTLREKWRYTREGERYHHIGRSGNRVFVVYSGESRKKGVLALDATPASSPRSTAPEGDPRPAVDERGW
jgi:hypothetical protein